MQTVFEKIIEKLEEEKMSYFLTIANTGDEKLDYSYEQVGNALDDAIEIVKQAEEQYNNGWIPCNELLPAYGQTVLASVCAEDAEWKIIIACYKEEDFWLDGKIDAWQPLPTPYAKGE